MENSRPLLGGAAILAIGTALVIAILLAATPVMTSAVMPALGARASDAALVETVFNTLVFGAILIAAMIGAAADKRNALTLGTRPALNAAAGVAIGTAGISASAGYALLAGTLVNAGQAAAAPAMLGWGLVLVLLQTLAEEAYFRGWLQPALAKRWGLTAALIATSLAFAGLHVVGGARAPISLLNLFLGGLMFGLLAARGGGLAAALGTHFAWNAVEQLGYGLDPNPGVGTFGAIADRDLVGAAMWGGSEEGLNGSLGMTVALLAIVVPLAMMSWRRPVVRAAPLSSPQPATG